MRSKQLYYIGQLGSTEPIDTLEQLEIMLREVGQTARGEMLRNAEYKTIVKRNVCLGTHWQPDQPARLGAVSSNHTVL